ncbi:serine/threonine-protein kinase TNNI3K-like isoform X3 [Bolinopsis microptera]|uniref:serine/threonine-protein kinase TNNI3K-like isoform X3 n=1 Tax=Bolinopsis microptera TaxID=2820187 RepID=UPI00307AAC1B
MQRLKTTAGGLYESALSMLESGENPNQYSEDGFTPICLAAFWGKSDIVKALLNFGADVNLANIGSRMTPLHAAAFQGHGKIAHLLLEAGSEMEVEDKYGNTPVYYASSDDAIWPLFASKGCSRKPVKQPQNEPDIQESEAQIKKDFEAYISPLREHHHANGDVLGMDNPPMLEQPVFAIEWGK